MGNRNAIWILTLIPLTLAALGGRGIEPATAQATVASGAAFTGIVRPVGPAAVSVAWTLRDQDLFACQNAAYDLRALIREYGAGVAVHAIAVDADPALVASFLRNERLNIPVSYLTAQQYRVAYLARPRPGVSVLQHGRLVETVNTGQLHVRGRRDTSSLDEIVRNAITINRVALGGR